MTSPDPGVGAPDGPVSPSPTDVPEAISSITAPIDRVLRELIATERDRWVDVHPALSEPFAALEALVLGGGKRIRPAFFHWAHVGGGGEPSDPAAVRAAAAIEMLHAFALAHDDVMDRSTSRRGVPSIWHLFASAHRDRSWHGDPERFGDSVAILVGDLAHVAADHLVDTADPVVSRIWDDLRFEVNIGQYLDVLAGAQGRADPAIARLILEYKTGRYSVQRPLQLGAAMAGAHERLSEHLTRYGRPVGVAFQLRDDMLGAFGDSDLTGKPVGDDLREGKPTLLLATAFERASASQEEILDLAGHPDLDQSRLSAIQEVLVETGAVQAIETEIGALTEEALACLDTMTLVEPAGAALAELATFVAFRTH